MNLTAILAQAPPAGTTPNPTGELIKMVGMLGMLIAMVYFVIIRPQNKRTRQQAEMLKAIRPGDKIMTSGGIIAVVVTVKEKSATIRSGDAKLEIAKTAITEITERSGESSES